MSWLLMQLLTIVKFVHFGCNFFTTLYLKIKQCKCQNDQNVFQTTLKLTSKNQVNVKFEML